MAQNTKFKNWGASHWTMLDIDKVVCQMGLSFYLRFSPYFPITMAQYQLTNDKWK